jgi:uncharacterized protein (TIRG00374 family)
MSGAPPPHGPRPKHPAHHDYAHELPESGLEIVLDPPDIDEGSGTGSEDVSADQISLSRRLRDPRTIVSIAVPLVIVALAALTLGKIDFGVLTRSILNANPFLLLVAFGSYYLGFPFRGWRWRSLLQGTGLRISLRDSTEIIFISWLVNCVVPAKLGDVYRAYLLRLNFDVSLSRTFGTVFIERIFDLFAIAILGLAAGFWSFRNFSSMSTEVQVILGVGVVVAILLAIGLFTLRNFGRRTLLRLHVPHRVIEFYDRFEEGVFSIQPRQVPALATLTAIIWLTEAMRLYFVIEALGLDVHIGISGAFFVALSASLLTAIPLSPAGLGVVEGAVVGILTVIYQVPLNSAIAIILVDRAISVLSIIVLGGITYVVSAKTKAGPRAPAEVGAPAT